MGRKSSHSYRTAGQARAMKKLFVFFVLLFICVLTSCGYSTRSSLAAHIKTIAVVNFVNKIDLQSRKPSDYVPLLEVKAHDAVVNQFLFDGNLRSAPQSSADLVLKGELIDYNRNAIRFTSNDDVQQYRITVTVHLTMLDDKGQVLWEEPSFSGEATYFLNGSNATSEDSAINGATEDLAKRIVERTVEDW